MWFFFLLLLAGLVIAGILSPLIMAVFVSSKYRLTVAQRAGLWTGAAVLALVFMQPGLSAIWLLPDELLGNWNDPEWGGSYMVATLFGNALAHGLVVGLLAACGVGWWRRRKPRIS
ncbi:hypothetical protein EJV47_15845 [Hymenobacter gummosus]|uniref:Uncharacterized protein n=1 Tax=Hymenobacter gummosus TaxID=1776032 RepID=A0A3S0IM55_9BACT|nr:hypothetical protein [Hymenobacter gummosus]RTQ48444.1 hypothetical protein EJV47_15845 [Hymenobacter gummosus]